ncbi:hypothetical protein [Mammaliicoccus vitulinus]|uniref:hypothetical protein n=1 Tax=Mammaliicoccus vitulinus TaxID=71237 RepID=UPI0028D4DA58|nr:hypothetical protein [Mammaliicoccus vitulinus]
MYSALDRENIRNIIIDSLVNENVDGIIQIGSGVQGYNDKYSDLDMMIAYNGDLIDMKNKLKNIYTELGAFYIKDLQLRDNIYLITPFFENGLEINSSLLPIDLLSVKSPLWKIEYDKHGEIYNKMNQENKNYIHNMTEKVLEEEDIFDFMYAKRKLHIALNRKDVIHANQMLEMMRDYLINYQVILENKKFHQFKSYKNLNLDFQNEFLKTFPSKIDLNSIEISANKVNILFEKLVSSIFNESQEAYLIRKVGYNVFNTNENK